MNVRRTPLLSPRASLFDHRFGSTGESGVLVPRAQVPLGPLSKWRDRLGPSVPIAQMRKLRPREGLDLPGS